MTPVQVRARVGQRRPAVALVAWHSSPLARPGTGAAGGMNVYVREVAAALAATGLRVDILTAASRPASVGLGDGVRMIALPPARLTDEALPRYDVVHSHYWQSATPARILVERSRARHIHTFHTLGEVKNAVLAPGDVPESEQRLHVESSLLREVDAVIVATAAEQAQTVDVARGRPARIHIVPPGVDGRRFRPAAPGAVRAIRAHLGLDDAPTVVHVGRIQPLKAVDVAVRALRVLGGGIGRARLLLAGGPSGPAGPAAVAVLRAEARRLPRSLAVRFAGPVSRGALPALLAACEIAVVPSRAESFCLAALEAQACGLPVVGTAVGGLPDVVVEGHSGFLVAGRPDPFAARLGELLSSAPLRRRMAHSAVESARRYTWSATAAAIRDVYEL